MARQGKRAHNTRWRVLTSGRWTVADALKLLALGVVLLLVGINFSMLSNMVHTQGEALQRLRSTEQRMRYPGVTVPSMVTEDMAADIAPKPWFLDPTTYERESGCDFSSSVRLFKPEALEINCANIDQLVLGDYLGEGFWRKVYKAHWNGRDVAVKVVKEKLIDRTDIIPRHVEESAAIFPIRNEPNIVGLVGWCNTTVIVDYVPTALDALLYHSDEVISVKRALRLSRDAARGLAQLHNVPGGPFAHTDLQARQFLIDSTGRLQLNDFNRVKYTGPRINDGVPTDEKCKFSTSIAKGKWRSPEEYKHLELDEKLDIYSLSLVMWSILARVKPYEEMAREQVYEQVPKGLRPPIAAMSGYPQQMQDLIVRAWDADPAKRPTALELAVEIDRILNNYDGERAR